MRWVAVVVACASCYSDDRIACGDLSCPATLSCSPDQTCVTQSQLDACVAQVDGSTCSYDNFTGLCHDQTCVTSLDMCGDGVTSPALGELCDCGSPTLLLAPPVACNGFNSDAPGATCRASCTPARCGDGILDPGEVCDDGNTRSGDGCRGDCQGDFALMQTPTGNVLSQVIAFAPADVYAIGVNTIIHYDGVAWSNIDVGLPSQALIFAIWGSGPRDVYVSGSSGTPTVSHFDGTGWTVIDTGASTVVIDGWASSPSDVYAIAQSLLHFDGSTWSAVSLAGCGASYGALAVGGTNPSNVVVGDNLNGLCRFDGLTWSLITAGTGTPGEIVGAPSGAILSLSNTTLTIVPPTGAPTTVVVPGAVRAIAATSTSLLAVGNEGLVLQLDLATQQWTHLVTPTDVQLNGVTATSPTDVFIVGDVGTALH